MINHSILLIIGAGAHNPYGFPLGSALVKEIVLIAQDPGRLNVLQEIGFSRHQIDHFCDQLSSSCEEHVERFIVDRPEFREIGRAAIAAVILSYENPARMNTKPSEVDDWFRLLWDHLKTDTINQQYFNRLKIITFNYDRSLEFFLVNELQKAFDRTFSECWKVINAAVPILHVHGSIGSLDERAANYLEYGQSMTHSTLTTAARSLVLTDEPSMEKNREICAHFFDFAPSVCYLGFGYADSNLQLIHANDIVEGPMETPKGMMSRSIYGSTLGMSDEGSRNVASRCNAAFSRPDHGAKFISADCTTTLTRLGLLSSPDR